MHIIQYMLCTGGLLLYIFQVVNSVRIRRAGDWSARIIRLTGWMPIRADASMSNPKPKTGERSQKHSRTGTTPISDSIFQTERDMKLGVVRTTYYDLINISGQHCVRSDNAEEKE